MVGSPVGCTLCERLDQGWSDTAGSGPQPTPRIAVPMEITNAAAARTEAADTRCGRTRRTRTMDPQRAMSARDPTSPTEAKGARRASSGGDVCIHDAVRGAGGVPRSRPEESIDAQRPVLAPRTMGVRVSMARKREICTCCARPASNQPYQPSLVMFTRRSARRSRPEGAG
ncbi:MAG: hypothetical protein ACKOEP_02910 [Phycisphaerales bacterium]